jgi:hypothetical protein
MAVASVGPLANVADVRDVAAEGAPLQAAVTVALPRARALLFTAASFFLQAFLFLVVVVDGLPPIGGEPREDDAS